MKNLIRNTSGIATLVLMVITISRCSKNSSAPVSGKQIKIQSNAALGKILTDKDGRTLYSFANDVSGQSSCTGDCERIWPAFYVDNLAAGELEDPDLKITDFASITSSSGKRQLTYKGWPLYYYSPGGNPEAAGQTSGEGILGLGLLQNPIIQLC